MSDERDDFSEAFNEKPQKDALAPAAFDIAVDKKTGQVWVLHDQAFLSQDRITAGIYDRGDHRLKFVTLDGAIQYLGAVVQEPLQPYLEKAKEIAAILTDKDGNILNAFSVPLKQEGGIDEGNRG